MADTLRVLKPSLYNVIIPKIDGLAVYNTKTGQMIRSFEDSSPEVMHFLTSSEGFTDDKSNNILTNLFAQGFLIEYNCNELDEMSRMEKAANFDNYLRLTILPTEYCNFRCVYCYEHFKRGKMSEEVQKTIIESVDDQIDQFDGLIVSWFGGEPLEAIDIIENLSKEFLRICKNHKKVYSAGITTNGYELTVERVRLLKKLHVTDYQVTLDGIPAIHDMQRILRDGSGTAEKIIENLLAIKEQVKSSTITIVLRTNFSKELMLHIDEFGELIDHHFTDDSRFNFYWQMAGDYGFIRDDSIRDIFGTKYDYFYLMKYFTKRFDNRYMSHLYGPAGGVCYALKRNAFVISSDGIIKKCTCDMEEEKNCFGRVGEIFDNNKHEAWLKRDISSDSKCYLCIKRPICHNKACYKAKGCLPNLTYLENVLDLMSDKSKNYVVI